MANRYTIIKSAEDIIDNSAINTKDVIDSNLYDNDNQEITGEMNNRVVSTVTTMSRDNDLLFTDYLIKTDTRVAKATLYDGYRFGIVDGGAAKFGSDRDFAILTIDIPGYTDVLVRFNIADYAANSLVTTPTGSLEDEDTVYYADIPNTEYSTLFPKSVIRYDLLGSTDSSRYYHWSNNGVIRYNVNFETRLVLCVKYNGVWKEPNVELNGESLDISRDEYGLVYLPEYYYDYNLEPKTVENNQWNVLNYAIAQRHDIDYSLSTRLNVWHEKLYIDTDNNSWKGGDDLIVLELKPYDKFTIKDVIIGDSGLAVTTNEPHIGTPLDIAKMAPTPEIMYGGDYTNLEYYPRDYVYRDLGENGLEITNTLGRPIYISFNLFKPDLNKAVFQVNEQDIFYPGTTEKNENLIIDEYGNNDVLVSSSNVLFLKRQLTYMTELLLGILQDIH